MAKNAHTGGEGATWEISCPPRYIRDQQTGARLAETVARRRGPVSNDIERLANARMFAATPRMLRALRKVAAVMNGRLSLEIQTDVKQAIEAATGEDG